MKTLCNAAMKPSLSNGTLNRTIQKKDQSYFERLGEIAKRQHLDKTGQFHQKKVGVAKASYEVSLLVAQNMKAHTIAESLVLPAAKTLIRNLIGDETVAKVDSASLSNDTVKRHIQEMSGHIAEQVIESSGLPFKLMS